MLPVDPNFTSVVDQPLWPCNLQQDDYDQHPAWEKPCQSLAFAKLQKLRHGQQSELVYGSSNTGGKRPPVTAQNKQAIEFHNHLIGKRFDSFMAGLRTIPAGGILPPARTLTVCPLFFTLDIL